MVDTILITGATGTVGSEVIKQLVSSATSNFNIKAAVHSQEESKKRVAAEMRVKPVQIDTIDQIL